VLSIAMLAYMRHLAPAPLVAPSVALDVPESRLSEAPPEEEEPPAVSLPVIALSGLKEDERRLYDMIVDRGGEVLQRDLVASEEFSKAKVTRLLDKLEGRGLIKRERHGMTNMVKLLR